jgi:hypothetical protein
MRLFRALSLFGLFHISLALPRPEEAQKQSFVPTVVVHGGAGDVANVTGKYEGTKAAIRAAYQVCSMYRIAEVFEHAQDLGRF